LTPTGNEHDTQRAMFGET